MATQSYDIEVQDDFLARLTQTKPIPAIAELIWNGLDADAKKVEIFVEENALGFSKIIIRDNGHGFTHNEAPDLFKKLGGSWKKQKIVTDSNRMLHGAEGRGRFKAFALGRVAEWHVTYMDNSDNTNKAYCITMKSDNLRKGSVSDVVDSETLITGVEVQISELHKDFKSLKTEIAIQELSEIFALYLKDYQDVTIRYQGQQIDPNTKIVNNKIIDLPAVTDGEETYPVKLEIIEWRGLQQRALYLCNENGFPLTQVDTHFHVDGFQFSSYLKSSYIKKLYNEGRLELYKMEPLIDKCVDEAKAEIKKYFKARLAEEASSIIDEWKRDSVYPFAGEAVNPIEVAERQVFDIVATKVTEQLSDFSELNHKNKAFHLRMLRQAIERSPDELQEILGKVLELPKREQQQLADLLKKTTLTAIISASRLVADRLNFISGLEAILFDDPYKKQLKERTQLHQILADNAWFFGEAFNISVDDQSLTEVLKKHKKLLGDDVVINEPVKHIDKIRGIVDLMLSRTIRQHRADELEHLVVELKAPKVKIGSKEISQIEGYAFSVTDDERFKGVNTKWTFVVISDDYDKFAEKRIRNSEGTIYDQNNIIVGVKTWAQILQGNKARYQFFQEKLAYQVEKDDSLKYLQENYATYLHGVLSEAPEKEKSQAKTIRSKVKKKAKK